MEQACQECNVASLDLIGPLIEKLAEFIETQPAETPGLLHQVDDDYFDRIDALAFTVRHDDNRSPEDLHEADIILVGVSRTSKTTLGLIHGQYGWIMANIPDILGEVF